MEGVLGGALSHLRVLELPGGVATRYCGRLFAQLGATVLAAGEDRDAEPGSIAGAGGAYAQWLDAGKQRVPAAGRAVAHADLVIAGQDEGAVVQARELITAAGSPGPSLLAIRWFDPRGPYGRWHGCDEVIFALSGLAYGFGMPQGPPMLARGHAPQVVAGVTAFTAGVAALLSAPPHRPAQVDVNVLESFLCLSETAAVAALADPDIRSARLGVNRFMPAYPCSSYRSRDGWVGVTCLTPAQWRSLCQLIGRPEASSQPELATALSRLRHAEEVDALLAPALAGRTSAEWVADGLAGRIPIVAMPQPHELPAQEHWRQRGSFSQLPGTNAAGPTLPFRYAHDGVTRRGNPGPPAPGPPAPGPPAPGPLGGVRVADFTMGWAGPLATRMLADLGADVIKVESEAHPDWWRGWEASEGDDSSRRELRPNFNTVNRGKRGVSLDLTTQPGLAAARALVVAGADVVIENFAAGVLDKLGLGLDAEWARGRPAAEAAARLQEAGVPAAPVLPGHTLGADPHLAATGVWQIMEREYAGRHAVGAAAFRFDGSRPPLSRPAPTLGQHTAELLAGAETENGTDAHAADR